MKYNSNKKLTSNAQKLRKEMTKEERKLWYEFLKSLPVTINRQKTIGSYIVDFCCHSSKIIIELDGGQHYEMPAIEYDKMRTAYLENLGYKILRYSNLDVLQNFEGVCEDILRHI